MGALTPGGINLDMKEWIGQNRAKAAALALGSFFWAGFIMGYYFCRVVVLT